MTTHMLKKCIKVPKVVMQSTIDPNGLSLTEYNRVMDRQKEEPFKRGVMCFDDFNYDLYNQYILVDPNYNEEDISQPLPKGFVPKTVEKNKRGQVKQDSHDTESLALTDKNLLEICPEKYVHAGIDVMTEEEKKEEAMKKQILL